MNQTIVTQIKNGKIVLPKELRKDWQTGEALFTRTPDGFFIKSIARRSLSAIARRLSRAAKEAGITPKDVKLAIASARKKIYAGRA